MDALIAVTVPTFYNKRKPCEPKIRRHEPNTLPEVSLMAPCPKLNRCALGSVSQRPFTRPLISTLRMGKVTNLGHNNRPQEYATIKSG